MLYGNIAPHAQEQEDLSNDDPLCPSAGIVHAIPYGALCWLVIILVILALVALFSPAKAAGFPESTPLPAGTPITSVPSGVVRFCISAPAQCSTRGGSVVELTEQRWHTLRRVNDAVNDSITPESDQQHYGRADYWTIPTDGYGDCEDYALAKRAALIRDGFPAGALRIATVVAFLGRHAVLVVTTDHGDYVLDNLAHGFFGGGYLVPWHDTGYVFVERQSPYDMMRWYAFNPAMAEIENNGHIATSE